MSESKIYILPVKKEFQPPKISVIYPAHNVGCKDAELLYLEYLNRNRSLVTNNPNEADWHYLPVFWTHWLVDHDFGRQDLDKLQTETNRVIIDDTKTFTIYEYAEQPKVDLGKTIAFLGSRTSKEGFDIPLLCAPHPSITPVPSKKYWASFVGKIGTHPIRKKMSEKFRGHEDICILESKGTEYFIQTMLESFIGLAPRGYGGASYRFYEAMQLGTVPFLIGDIDHRPFKKFLNWDIVSLYANDIDDFDKILNRYSKVSLSYMGRMAKQFYEENFSDGNWCKYVIKTLEEGL